MDILLKKIDEFKQLNDIEKKQAIVEFLKNNIASLKDLNSELNNDLGAADIASISKEPSDDYLDVIYQLLHVMTKQVELFTEKVSIEFYE